MNSKNSTETSTENRHILDEKFWIEELNKMDKQQLIELLLTHVSRIHELNRLVLNNRNFFNAKPGELCLDTIINTLNKLIKIPKAPPTEKIKKVSRFRRKSYQRV